MNKFIPFTADVMFCEVMKDEEICCELIERIIDRPLEKIIYCNQQETITSSINTRSIRLDVCVETKDGKLIDVEMQVGNCRNLGLRFRGYQSIMDSSYWKRGDKFEDLKETYIIFLCTNDPFLGGLPIYTIEPICSESILVDIDCKTHWIALNAQAYEDAPMRIRNLLQYMTTKDYSNDALVDKINNLVTTVNQDPKKVMEMTTVQDRYDEFQWTIDEQKKLLKSKDKEIELKDQKLESKDKEIKNLKKQLAQLQK